MRVRMSWLVFVGVFGFTVYPWPALAAVADSWKADWEQTLAAAKKEGEISFYGSQGYEKVFEVFQKKYPEIKVNAVTNMRGSEHGARVMTERRAGKYLVGSFYQRRGHADSSLPQGQHSRTNPTGANPA